MPESFEGSSSDSGAPEKPEKFSDTIGIGDLIVTTSGTRRIVQERNDGEGYFLTERTKALGVPESEKLKFHQLNNTPEALDYVLTPEQQDEVWQREDVEKVSLSEGDTIVGKNGTERKLLEIIPNQTDPDNPTYRLERKAHRQKKREDIMERKFLLSKRNTIDYKLNPAQQVQTKAAAEKLYNEYARDEKAWTSTLVNVIGKRIFRRGVERTIAREQAS